MVQGQVEAYKIDFHNYPTLEELATGGFIKDKDAKCPDGRSIIIVDGKVDVVEKNDEPNQD